MAKLVWDEVGSRTYETGVRNGVLYLMNNDGSYPNGVAWNGLSSVSESPSGAEANPIYADDMKYLNLYSAEEFGATVEAYTYPDEFAQCDGSASIASGVSIGQQNRKAFGMVYRTTLGNDVEGDDYGYKLHIIYNAKASPSEKQYSTINDSPEAITMSWELSTTPVPVPGHKSTALITIDSTKCDKINLEKLERVLFGSETSNPRLPLPEEISEIMNGEHLVLVTKAESPVSELFGKMVSELQTGVSINNNVISGNLHEVTDYTEFSSKPEEQSGHYLALKFDTSAETETTVELVGGTLGQPVTLDEDKNIVLLIGNINQTIKVVTTDGEETVTEVYSLSGLILE